MSYIYIYYIVQSGIEHCNTHSFLFPLKSLEQFFCQMQKVACALLCLLYSYWMQTSLRINQVSAWEVKLHMWPSTEHAAKRIHSPSGKAASVTLKQNRVVYQNTEWNGRQNLNKRFNTCTCRLEVLQVWKHRRQHLLPSCRKLCTSSAHSGKRKRDAAKQAAV